jgi:prepilin-type N-terminal cleavage/methylation domain-containing protein
MEPICTPACRKRGVTLIELLVVLGIITVLAVVVVTSNTTFQKTILLTNTAYDVALTIRSAETYGLGSRVTSSLISKNTGYGVHFDKATPTSFILFADVSDDHASNLSPICHALRPLGASGDPDSIPGDCIYTAGTGKDVVAATYSLGNGMKIAGLYYYPIGSTSKSSNLTTLDIVFSRPNPQTFIAANQYYVGNTRACITISSPQNVLNYIHIESSGEIHVNQAPC